MAAPIPAGVRTPRRLTQQLLALVATLPQAQPSLVPRSGSATVGTLGAIKNNLPTLQVRGYEMADRIEIAKKFIEEQRQQRDDIIGAFVEGSVARGEDTKFSDIDLVLVVEGTIQHNEIHVWRDGVFVDSLVVSRETYTDPEQVLQNPFQATHINDALILFDPTEFLTRLQQEVRADFMAIDEGLDS